VLRRLAVILGLGGLACQSHSSALAPNPLSMDAVVAAFLHAVKANDLDRLGTLWGTERGPAATWMPADELKKRLTVIQKYLNYDGYRVVDGPLAVGGHDNERTFRVELERQSCNVVVPLDLIQAKTGQWLVIDAHLESVSNPEQACKPAGRGTGP
jgi:hypothetical protein